MIDIQHVPLWEMEMHETALYAKLDNAPPYLRDILTPTQYKYYVYYIYGGLKLADIAMYWDVDITTVCRTIKNAKKRILAYHETQLKGV